MGRAGIALPLDDNTDLAHVTLDVLPAAEGRGLGRKLLEAAELFVKGENRRIVVVETNHPAADLHAEAPEHLAATRDGSLMPLSSREALFAHNAGYVLEQVEQFGACALPLPAGLGGSLKDRRNCRPRTRPTPCTSGWTPARKSGRRTLCAWSKASATTTAHRSRGMWRNCVRRRNSPALTGRHTLVSAAECLETGALVAFTSISVLKHRDDVAFQDDTVVEPEHRGKDVGCTSRWRTWNSSCANFRRSRPSTPGIPRTTPTCSPSMPSLGFVGAGVTGQWRKDFDAVD